MKVQITSIDDKVFVKIDQHVTAFWAKNDIAAKRVLEVIEQQVAAVGAELEGVTKDQMFPRCELWDSIGEPDWIGIPNVVSKFGEILAQAFTDEVFDEIRMRLEDEAEIQFADGMKAARQNLAYPEDEREEPTDNLLRTVEEIAYHMGYMKVWDAAKVPCR